MGTRPPTDALSLQGGLLSLSNSLALPRPSEVSTKHPLLDRLGLDVHQYKILFTCQRVVLLIPQEQFT